MTLAEVLVLRARRRPPAPFIIFDLRALVLMRQATEGIDRLADRCDFELPLLVDRIKQIGAAA